MQESMYKYMKVGIIHFMAFPETMGGVGPIYQTIEKIVGDDYFNAIEITEIKDEKERERVRKLLETSHMAVGYGAQPSVLMGKLNPNSPNKNERRKALDVLKEQADQAAYMGAGRMAFLSGPDPGDADRGRQIELLAQTTLELCSYAKSNGSLGIAIEVFDRKIDKKSLIGPVGDVKKLCELVTREIDNFGVMVDLSHLPLIGETPQQAILPIKDYFVHAHIGNGVLKKGHEAYGDTHPRFGIQGGENDVPQLVEFLRVLMDVGYLNTKNPPFLSFEVRPRPGESAEAVIANSKRVLNEAWARL